MIYDMSYITYKTPSCSPAGSQNQPCGPLGCPWWPENLQEPLSFVTQDSPAKSQDYPKGLARRDIGPKMILWCIIYDIWCTIYDI